MNEYKIKIGFIIFYEGHIIELESENGHRKTAFNWIKENNLFKLFKSVLGTNGIYDEEDFLIEYIGAIKLYAYSGNLYCKIPKILNGYRNYYEEYFEKRGYKIISNGIYDEEKPKVKVYKNDYNKTILKKYNHYYIYNPLKDGD